MTSVDPSAAPREGPSEVASQPGGAASGDTPHPPEAPFAGGAPPWERLGLRERKRLQAMRRIQTVALDEFEAHGFDAVTIEQIAARSEVSPSTVYRYFGTKEMLVIRDEYDPVALQAITDELDTTPPLEAVRRVVLATVGRALADDEERIRRRLRLAYRHPTIEAAATLHAHGMADLIAGVLARKLGRDPEGLDLQVFAHAVVGGLLGALRHWYRSGFETPLETVVARPLSAVEGGVDLTAPDAAPAAEDQPRS